MPDCFRQGLKLCQLATIIDGAIMLTVKRFINGVPIEPSELKNIVIDSSLIRHIIADVNNRLKYFSKQNSDTETVEITNKKVCSA